MSTTRAKERRRIGITLGEQAGVGPEIVEKALASGMLPEGVDFTVIGQRVDVKPGKPTLESARAALEALEESVVLLQSGEIDAVVTAPVAKDGLHELGFHFPGQTEFFAERLGCGNHAMCLTGRQLTVALVTIHVALAEVPGLLRQEEIVRVGKLLADFCHQRGIARPRIAVCGLNPHAGENGAFGNEDEEMVAPAVCQLQQEYAECEFSGPHPPDTIFRPAVDGHYDAVLCMYHDQGLIPLKLLDFDTGVNVTLGLPMPRTSPDHGTAYDIAGSGSASASSMIHAIQLACEMVAEKPV
ncbi:4-hydroxythreonine-4-phosphate dehydrogenase PdxA [Verrucomicrobiaceae bacterium N1E253]|uniref:4-hydroxythreonine-4-phosphate dehydrogenase PdxA n=1 Tax=Oceaniferula marina TaxID=2748318 RepID=A0A851GI51_9BACT|nr:4-hydroxythreonine-4-phosphate dehydrogenase PdxA [Oceaniferula marina]NWK56592.1 4-hydroxythreonine-4-phosphate dehydrogenase PdxA [Oceaniferula marina]